MGPPETFVVERRYSDFHTFHLQLKAKVRCYISSQVKSPGILFRLHMSKLHVFYNLPSKIIMRCQVETSPLNLHDG